MLYKLVDTVQSNKFLINQNTISTWNKKMEHSIFQEEQKLMGLVLVAHLDQLDCFFIDSKPTL